MLARAGKASTCLSKEKPGSAKLLQKKPWPVGGWAVGAVEPAPTVLGLQQSAPIQWINHLKKLEHTQTILIILLFNGAADPVGSRGTVPVSFGRKQIKPCINCINIKHYNDENKLSKNKLSRQTRNEEKLFFIQFRKIYIQNSIF